MFTHNKTMYGIRLLVDFDHTTNTKTLRLLNSKLEDIVKELVISECQFLTKDKTGIVTFTLPYDVEYNKALGDSFLIESNFKGIKRNIVVSQFNAKGVKSIRELVV